MKDGPAQTTPQHQTAAAPTVSEQRRMGNEGLEFEDNRKESVAQTKLQVMIDASPRMLAQRTLQGAMNNSHRVTQLQLQSHQPVLQFAGKAELQTKVDTEFPSIAKTLMAGVLDQSDAGAAAKKSMTTCLFTRQGIGRIEQVQVIAREPRSLRAMLLSECVKPTGMRSSTCWSTMWRP